MEHYSMEHYSMEPIFDFCLGNQFFELASGAKTFKMRIEIMV